MHIYIYCIFILHIYIYVICIDILYTHDHIISKPPTSSALSRLWSPLLGMWKLRYRACWDDQKNPRLTVPRKGGRVGFLSRELGKCF